MLHEVAKRHLFGYLQCPLDFIASGDSLGFDAVGNVDDSLGTASPIGIVVVHRRMQGMQLHFRVAEPVGELIDLRPVLIVQMLARAEYSDSRNTGRTEFVERGRRQSVVD